MSQLASVDQQKISRLSRLASVAVIVMLAMTGLNALERVLFAQAKTEKQAGQHSDAGGRKYVNKIPYDVFFDNPLQFIANSKSVANPLESPTEQPVAPPKTSVAPTTTIDLHENSWQLLLPMGELQSEIKTIRNSLSKSLANQGQFRQNLKTIVIHGTELAALAAIVQDHEEPLSWKDKAKYVREFSTQISVAATGLSKEDFEKTKSAFQRLSTALDGSIPADAGDVPDIRPFAESASRKGLMKRIEKAKDWLKQDVNSDAKFKSMSDQIAHETAILSALTTVITRTGYEYTDNEDYQSFAKTLIDGAKDAAKASSEGTYEKFKLAIDKVNKSCTDCHGTYGNG